MRTLRDSLNERMKNESFRREYEAIQPEMNVIRILIEARRERSMTQADLAARTGIDQADISRLENGSRNPSLNMLKKLASGLGMTLKLEFVPEQQQEVKVKIKGL